MENLSMVPVGFENFRGTPGKIEKPNENGDKQHRQMYSSGRIANDG